MCFSGQIFHTRSYTILIIKHFSLKLESIYLSDTRAKRSFKKNNLKAISKLLILPRLQVNKLLNIIIFAIWTSFTI